MEIMAYGFLRGGERGTIGTMPVRQNAVCRAVEEVLMDRVIRAGLLAASL